MGIEHKQHNEMIDKTLAALRGASPPEGMETRIEARIAERLQRQASIMPAEFRWRDLFARTAMAGAWWRGAVSGAAAAMLVAGVVLFAQHGLRVGSEHGPGHGQVAVGENVATRNHAPAATPVAEPARNAGQALGNPCVGPKVLHVSNSAPARASDTLLAEALAAVNAPSHPAPELPMTAQEQALVELARTADPKMLVALAPETQAKVEAQEEENYTKFFAPPPAPPQPATNASPTNTNENRTAPKEGEQI